MLLMPQAVLMVVPMLMVLMALMMVLVRCHGAALGINDAIMSCRCVWRGEKVSIEKIRADDTQPPPLLLPPLPRSLLHLVCLHPSPRPPPI